MWLVIQQNLLFPLIHYMEIDLTVNFENHCKKIRETVKFTKTFAGGYIIGANIDMTIISFSRQNRSYLCLLPFVWALKIGLAANL